jgi:large subunit ribosomal protein L10
MALTRAKKTLKVEALAKDLAGSTSAIVGTFTKLTVAQDFALRQKVREAGGRYRVLKNTLAARASMGTGIEGALQGLKGVSSVAYTSGDPVALAKALSAWVKDNAEFTFKLGIVEGKVITVEEVQSLATMPGKDEIFAKLLFLISAPAQRLVTVMNAASRDLAVVINQGVEKGRFAEGKAASAPASKPVPAPEAEVVAEVVPVPEVLPAPVAAEVETVAAQAASSGGEAAAPVAVELSEAPASPEMEAPASPEMEAPASPEMEAPASPEMEAPAAVELPEGPAAPTIEAPAEPEIEAPSAPGFEATAGVEVAAAETVPVSSASSDASAAAGATFDGEAAQAAEVSPAPAPAEGPAAEGSEAESEATQAEVAATESPVEG